MSKSQLKYPGHPISREKAHVLKDSAIMSLNDFYRIRESALTMPTPYNTSKSPTPLKTITSTDTTNSFMQRALEHKNKILSYDRNNIKQYNPLLTYENKKITDPYTIVDKNDDAIKDLNILCKYAKIATIRDKQLDERKMMENLYKDKEKKLDLMMELERLKEIKFVEDREKETKKLNNERQQIIIDQILDNERVRIKKREMIEKEKLQMKLQLEKFEEEEKKRILHEKQLKEQIIKQCLDVDKYAILLKQKKKIEEKEEELKDAKYNIEKAKKEEEYLKEKKRIALEKEKEIQLMREKQKKAQDKQAELDAIRAQRDYDEAERKAILKEKQEEIMKQRKLRECIEDNEMHKKTKEKQMADHLNNEKEEYEKLEKERQRQLEEEKEKQRKKIQLMMENGDFVKNQIQEKAEKDKILMKEKYEEGRKLKQLHDAYYNSIEMIKQQKIAELRALNIKDKYILPVEKYKVIKKGK
jgi:hypothetical protein